MDAVEKGRASHAVLAEVLKEIRPELDLYLVANLGTDEDGIVELPQVRCSGCSDWLDVYLCAIRAILFWRYM